jgi:DNA repair proteins
LGIFRAAMLHCLEYSIDHGPLMATAQAVIDYLSFQMGHLPLEQLRVLFLNAQNHLVFDQVMVDGTICEAPCYPREILKRALEVGATGFILVHNHPSGDPTPSDADCKTTKRLALAAETLDVHFHDHIIVAGARWSSFRQLGLLPVSQRS